MSMAGRLESAVKMGGAEKLLRKLLRNHSWMILLLIMPKASQRFS